MSQDIQAFEDASPETQETLKELEAEGYTIAGKESSKEEPKESSKEEPKPEKVEEKPEEKPEVKPEENQDPAQPEADKVEKSERTPKYVPVNKHNEERHKRQEAERQAKEYAEKVAALEAQLSSATRNAVNSPSQENIDDVKLAATKLAEKHGLDAEFVAEFAQTMVDVASKRNTLPKDLEAKLQVIEQMKQQAEMSALEAQQEVGFNNEFNSVLKEFPDLADRKEELKQLAFSEGNVNTPLRLLALGYIHDNGIGEKGKKTAESPTHVSKKTEVIDFENMTEEEFKGLSDENYELYMKWLEKKR